MKQVGRRCQTFTEMPATTTKFIVDEEKQWIIITKISKKIEYVLLLFLLDNLN